MKSMHRTLVSLAIAAALGAGAAQAQVSDNVIKIGVLSDMSSLYTDLAGAGSVVAAKMAVEDSGIEKRGYKVEIVSADHQNKPDVGLGDRAPVVRPGQGRRHRRHARIPASRSP